MSATAAVHPADPILQAYGLGKLDDDSSESVSRHLEGCDPCRQRVTELSSDDFLGRLQQARPTPQNAASEWSPSAGSSSDGSSGPGAALLPTDTLPPELVDHPDWEIIRELGRGGMGVVYLARNRLMGRMEVLKVVGSHLIDRPGVFERFSREIQAAARLQHANIVTAYSAMRLERSLVLTMEFVDGYDLATMVKNQGPLPVAHASNFIHQAALGLQHAHERGMVHRDIKPANLILARDGKKAIVKVLDFGLAKVASEGQTESGLTHEGQMLGTPDYIAPEQIRDAQSADIRADIYSLGCTLYYLLTGGPPFRRDYVWDVYEAHRSTQAAPLNLVRPEVPVELAAVVAKMMAKDPGRRFQTPGEVAKVLTPFFKPAAPRLPMSGAEPPRVGTAIVSTEPPTAGPVPTKPESPAAAPAPAVRRPSKIEEDGVAWESLIVIKEDEPLITAAPKNPTVQKPRLVKGPADRAPWKSWPAAAAAFVLGVLVLGIIIYIKTDKGKFKVDIGKGETPVKVEAGNVVVEYDPKVESKDPKAKANGPSTSGPVSSPNPLARTPSDVSNKTSAGPGSITNSIGMTLNLIPAGSFMMGSSDADERASADEKPQHQVRITRPFFLGVCEVTQDQYEAVMGANPSWFSENGNGKAEVAGRSTDQHPVEQVSWLNAVKFCNKLSEKEGLATFYEIDDEKVTVPNWNGPGYRLPTEAEWEYACRANAPTRYSFGDDEVSLGEFGWYGGNSDGRTHVVGEKKPNRFGLFDMHGNVWERCWDGFGEGYYKESPPADPHGVDWAARRAFRGGCWRDNPPTTRSACRGANVPGYQSDYLGFRLARGEIGRTEIREKLSLGEAAETTRTESKQARTDAGPPTATAKPLESMKNSIGMTLNLIPAGTFMMGSSDDDKDARADEKPQHQVRITRPFYLGVCEVTQAQYEAVTGTNPSWFSATGNGKDKVAGQSTDRHPVEYVPWLDAVKFCNRLSEREDLDAFYQIDGEKVTVPNWNGPGYRLPTEAEWEYACRANTPTRYSFGDDVASGGEFAWFDGTHGVGEKRPNGFGLFDMHGNALEWCWDGFGERYYKESPPDDPRGVEGAADRVYRGGGWDYIPRNARSASRGRSDRGVRNNIHLGFRLARGQSVR